MCEAVAYVIMVSSSRLLVGAFRGVVLRISEKASMPNPRQDMLNMSKNTTTLSDMVFYKFPQRRLYSRQSHMTNSRELLT